MDKNFYTVYDLTVVNKFGGEVRIVGETEFVQKYSSAMLTGKINQGVIEAVMGLPEQISAWMEKRK